MAITVTYPGASAETVEGTVVQPIEQQMTGLDGLLYMSSESDKDGSITITLSFAQGTNPDIAQVQVQNKLQLALPRLPPAVQQQGVQVAKSAKNFLLAVAFVSTDRSMNAADIADFVASHVQDPVSRAPGVGNFQLFGAQYAMRIWLDPAKLDNYGLTSVDVANAIKAQNIQVASGELEQGSRRSPASSSMPRSSDPPTFRGRSSLGRSCCASRPTVVRCGCATWRASTSAARTTRRSPNGTGIRRRDSSSRWQAARTRSQLSQG